MPKVLIVDDSPAQLYSLRRLVEQAGHQALVAESGEQALEVAAMEHPAVILMDIVMPGMSGYQATRKLSRIESTRHIPVIFVSSRNGEADREWGQARQSGTAADRHIRSHGGLTTAPAGRHRATDRPPALAKRRRRSHHA